MFTEAALIQEHMLNIGLGLYLLILVLVLFFRADYYRGLIAKMKEPGASGLLSGALSLLIGVFLVLTHNVWALESRFFVTFVCWAFLINAILWLAVPVLMMKIFKHVASGHGYYVVLLVMFVVGAQLISLAAFFYLHL